MSQGNRNSWLLRLSVVLMLTLILTSTLQSMILPSDAFVLPTATFATTTTKTSTLFMKPHKRQQGQGQGHPQYYQQSQSKASAVPLPTLRQLQQQKQQRQQQDHVPGPIETTRDQIRSLVFLYNNALASRNAKLMAKRFTNDAVVMLNIDQYPMSTNSIDCFDDEEANPIESLFESYFASSSSSSSSTSGSTSVNIPVHQIKDLQGKITIGHGWAQDAGTCTLTTTSTKSKSSSMIAHYSFLYMWDVSTQQWKIQNHQIVTSTTSSRSSSPPDVEDNIDIQNSRHFPMHPKVDDIQNSHSKSTTTTAATLKPTSKLYTPVTEERVMNWFQLLHDAWELQDPTVFAQRFTTSKNARLVIVTNDNDDDTATTTTTMTMDKSIVVQDWKSIERFIQNQLFSSSTTTTINNNNNNNSNRGGISNVQRQPIKIDESSADSPQWAKDIGTFDITSSFTNVKNDDDDNTAKTTTTVRFAIEYRRDMTDGIWRMTQLMLSPVAAETSWDSVLQDFHRQSHFEQQQQQQQQQQKQDQSQEEPVQAPQASTNTQKSTLQSSSIPFPLISTTNKKQKSMSSQMKLSNDLPEINVTKEQVCGWFEEWNSALITLDPKQVLHRYKTDGALLVPSVSSIPKTTQQEILEYYQSFLWSYPTATVLQRHITIPDTTITTTTSSSSSSQCTDVGIVEYTLHHRSGEISKVQERYSFLYTFTKEHGWKIAEHITSTLSESLPSSDSTSWHDKTHLVLPVSTKEEQDFFQ